MADHPRFQIGTAAPDQCYRSYHGAALMTWVLGAADWWLDRRSPERLAVVFQHLNRHQVNPIHRW